MTTFCNICGRPHRYNSGGLTSEYTGMYCEGHGNIEELLKDLWKQPLVIYDEDLENLKWGYTSKEITRQMMDVALQRGEITIHQYLKILKTR